MTMRDSNNSKHLRYTCQNKTDLFLKRPISYERDEVADVDIDFCYMNYKKIKSYIVKKYGK